MANDDRQTNHLPTDTLPNRAEWGFFFFAIFLMVAAVFLVWLFNWWEVQEIRAAANQR